MQPMRRAGGGLKTYADFVGWANAQPATPIVANTTPLSTGAGLKRVTLDSFFYGDMYGSPWGGAPSYGLFVPHSNVMRIAQHSFPSEAAANANLGRVVLMQFAFYWEDTSVGGKSRNGYSSLGLPYDPDAPYAAWNSVRFDYFDDAIGKRVQVNPFAQTVQEFDL